MVKWWTGKSRFLSERKLRMKEGAIIAATIIAAPSPTKNARKERDPERHQTKKGHQWSFGMKAHLGVDAQSGLLHSVTGTAANVADIAQTQALLHGAEKGADVAGQEHRATAPPLCAGQPLPGPPRAARHRGGVTQRRETPETRGHHLPSPAFCPPSATIFLQRIRHRAKPDAEN